jgi:hypothetical protein
MAGEYGNPVGYDVTPWQYKVPQNVLGYDPKTEGLKQLANALSGGAQAFNQAKQEAIQQPMQNQIMAYDVERHKQAVAPKNVVGYDPTGKLPQQNLATNIKANDQTVPIVQNSDKFNLAQKEALSQFNAGLKQTGQLNDTAIKNYARLMADRKLPPTMYSTLFRNGQNGRQDFEKVVTEAQKINPQLDLAKETSDFKTASDTNIKKLEGSFDTVQSEIDKIMKLNTSVDRTAFPLLNKAILGIKQGLGDANTTEWESSINLFKDSLSTILSNGVITDSRLEIAKNSLSPDMSQEAFKRVMDDVVGVFVDFRKNAVEKQTGQFGNTEKPNTPSMGITQNKNGKFVVTLP